MRITKTIFILAKTISLKLGNKKNTKKERKLTISSRYQPRAYRQSVIVPEIRLIGKWLEELGFKEGKQVKVLIKNNSLTLTVDENKADNNAL